MLPLLVLSQHPTLKSGVPDWRHMYDLLYPHVHADHPKAPRYEVNLLVYSLRPRDHEVVKRLPFRNVLSLALSNHFTVNVSPKKHFFISVSDSQITLQSTANTSILHILSSAHH